MRTWFSACLALVAACSRPDGGHELPPPGPVLEALADRLAALDEGVAVDLDGDGHPEAREVKHADGSSEYTSDRDGDGHPEYRRWEDGRGLVRTVVDADGDGRAEEITESWSSPLEQRQVTTRDTDRNGRMDRRTTRLVRWSRPDVVEILEEEDTDEDGIFHPVRTADLPNRSRTRRREGFSHFGE